MRTTPVLSSDRPIFQTQTRPSLTTSPLTSRASGVLGHTGTIGSTSPTEVTPSNPFIDPQGPRPGGTLYTAFSPINPNPSNGYLPPLDGFQVAMNDQDLQYDRNQDGSVSIADLLILIQEHAAANEQTSDSPPGNSTSNLMAAPGDPNILTQAANPSQDLDRQNDELARSIFTELQNSGARIVPPNLQETLDSLPLNKKSKQSIFEKITSSFDQLDAKQVDKKAAKLAAQLQQRFQAAGFVTHPPINTPQLVRSLQLPSNIESKLLQNLASHYKSGLGINLYT